MIFSNVEYLHQNVINYFEEDDNIVYRDFHELICKFYDKIEIEYFDDVEYMMPIEFYSARN